MRSAWRRSNDREMIAVSSGGASAPRCAARRAVAAAVRDGLRVGHAAGCGEADETLEVATFALRAPHGVGRPRGHDRIEGVAALAAGVVVKGHVVTSVASCTPRPPGRGFRAPLG